MDPHTPYQPPITPGAPQPPPPAQTPYYPPQSAPPAGYYRSQPSRDLNSGIRTAGTVALWIWILAAAVPLVVVLLCVGVCVVSAIGGAVSRPTP